MAIIKSDGNGVWGFELPTKGWHDVTVHESIEIKGTKKDPNKKQLCIPFCFDGSNKVGYTAYCQLTTIPGLRQIVDAVVASKVHLELLKDKKVDLTVGVDEEVIRSDKFLHYIMAKLPGKTVSIHVDHGTYESVSDDGTIVKKPQANITEIRAAGAGGNSSAKTADKSASQPSTAAAAQPETATDEGGW